MSSPAIFDIEQFRKIEERALSALRRRLPVPSADLLQPWVRGGNGPESFVFDAIPPLLDWIGHTYLSQLAAEANFSQEINVDLKGVWKTSRDIQVVSWPELKDMAAFQARLYPLPFSQALGTESWIQRQAEASGWNPHWNPLIQGNNSTRINPRIERSCKEFFALALRREIHGQLLDSPAFLEARNLLGGELREARKDGNVDEEAVIKATLTKHWSAYTGKGAIFSSRSLMEAALRSIAADWRAKGDERDERRVLNRIPEILPQGQAWKYIDAQYKERKRRCVQGEIFTPTKSSTQEATSESRLIKRMECVAGEVEERSSKLTKPGKHLVLFRLSVVASKEGDICYEPESYGKAATLYLPFRTILSLHRAGKLSPMPNTQVLLATSASTREGDADLERFHALWLKGTREGAEIKQGILFAKENKVVESIEIPIPPTLIPQPRGRAPRIASEMEIPWPLDQGGEEWDAPRHGTLVKARDERFDFGLAIAREYAQQHGHLRPAKKEILSEVCLYKWLKGQELRIAKGTMPEERLQKLREIPEWNARQTAQHTVSSTTKQNPLISRPESPPNSSRRRGR